MKKIANIKKVPVLIFLLFSSWYPQCAAAQQTKNSDAFIVENYYKVKWGFADEFIELWKANHYPLLKKLIEKGDIISVTAENKAFPFFSYKR